MTELRSRVVETTEISAGEPHPGQRRSNIPTGSTTFSLGPKSFDNFVDFIAFKHKYSDMPSTDSNIKQEK
jgi:hypothetical protein